MSIFPGPAADGLAATDGPDAGRGDRAAHQEGDDLVLPAGDADDAAAEASEGDADDGFSAVIQKGLGTIGLVDLRDLMEFRVGHAGAEGLDDDALRPDSSACRLSENITRNAFVPLYMAPEKRRRKRRRRRR